MCIYYVYTHNHSVSLANWCLNSLLSSHHCLYRDHPHTVHLRCDGQRREIWLDKMKSKPELLMRGGKKVNLRKKKKRQFSPPTTLTCWGFIFCQIARKEHLCISCQCNFLPATTSPSHPLLHIAKRLTHAQSQFPVREPTPFIGYNMGRAEYIIMGALTFMIKSLSCIFQTAGPASVWQQRSCL